MTALRQRMIDAMVLRGFQPRTQESYLRVISQIARHYHRSPELITDQEVQAYLLHLVRDRHLARSSVNQSSSALRFLVCEVLGQADRRSRIPMALTPQRLPEVLSRAEVAAVLDAPMSLKARTFLMTAYATGMRVSELCHLRGCDIDSSPDRMCIRVVAGKGGHDRYSLLSPELLEQLQAVLAAVPTPCTRRGLAISRPTGPLQGAGYPQRRALLLRRTQCRRHRQGRRHPHAAPLLRDPSAGSRRGPEQHQPVARPRQAQHHQPLPAHGPTRLQRR